MTCYQYDPTYGFVTSVTSPANAAGVRPQTRYRYKARYPYYKNSSGSVVQQTNGIMRLETTASCGEANCAGTAAEAVTTLTYDQSGAVTNLLPISSARSSGYEGYGSITSTVGMTYDPVGNVLTMSGPLTGQVTRYMYDGDREVTGSIGPDPDGTGWLSNRATRVQYNGLGEPTLREYGTVASQSDADYANFYLLEQVEYRYDALGRTTLYNFNAQGFGSQSGTQQQTQYDYDGAGNVICETRRLSDYLYATPPLTACTVAPTGEDGADRMTVSNYDPNNGRLSSVIEGANSPDARKTSYTYDAATGQVATVTDPKGNVTTYKYDGFGRQNEIDYPSPTAVGQSSTTDRELTTYDSKGQVLTTTRRDGQVLTAAYDALGETIQVADAANAVTVGYAYDSLGRMTSATKGGKSVSFAYDALGRKTSETSGFFNTGSQSVWSQWDAAGNRTQLQWVNGFYLNYVYDLDNEATQILENGGYDIADITWNNRGVLRTVNFPNGVAGLYLWGPTRQLQNLNYTFPNAGNNESRYFVHTSSGQIGYRWTSNSQYQWSTTASATTLGYTVDGLNRTTSIASTPLSYDARSNLNNDGAATHTFDVLNRMTSASTGANMTYDALGRLASVTGANGAVTQFQYDGDKLITEYDGSGNLLRWYAESPYNDAPLAWYEGWGTGIRRWLLPDERGSIMAVSDSSGGLYAANTYDEYGLPGKGNTGRFQYTGQMWIPELGIYHYRARQYSPALGKFYQTDPTGYSDGLNMYAYAHADPVNGTDPNGLADPPASTTVAGLDVIGHRCPSGAICVPGNQLGSDPRGPTTGPLGSAPQNTQRGKDLACQASNALEQWSQSDARTAFGTSIGSFTANRLPGQLAVRAAKGLSGVTEVFSTASFLEGTGAALINGFKSGDFSGAVANVASNVLGKAAGLEGLPGETASQINDRIIGAAKFKNPCE